MFDITSWIREKVFRRPKIVPTLAGEELSEKQTTKLGYFLLVCMFFAILSTAQWTLSIITGIVESPKSVPVCVSQVLESFDKDSTSEIDRYSYGYSYSYYYRDYNDCNLVSENPVYDLQDEYNNLKAPYDTLQGKYEELSNLQSKKNDLQYQQEGNRRDYDTALYERTAGEVQPLYDGESVRSNITETDSTLAGINTQIQTITAEITAMKTQYAPQVSLLRGKLEQAQTAYERAQLVYRMKIAALSLVFVGLVFAVLYRMYVRRKTENSPHTVIFSVATFAYGIVLLQVFLRFLWDIIPHKFLEWLLGIISIFTPILYLLQFLWPIVIVSVFGYLVYRIQKRLYSPQNILKRFVTDKKCPNCGNAVDMTKPFCPLCSHEIQIHCPHCHALTMKGMPFCSNCGKEIKEEQVVELHSKTNHHKS